MGECCICGKGGTEYKTRDGMGVCHDCSYKTTAIYERWLYDSKGEYIKSFNSLDLAKKLRGVKTLFYGGHNLGAVTPGKEHYLYYDIGENRIGGGFQGGFITGGYSPDQIEYICLRGTGYRIGRNMTSGGLRATVQEIPFSFPRAKIVGTENNGIDIDIWIRVTDMSRVHMPIFNKKNFHCTCNGVELYLASDLHNITTTMLEYYRDLFIFLIEEGENIKRGKTRFPEIY